jgi:hypothetical protein
VGGGIEWWGICRNCNRTTQYWRLDNHIDKFCRRYRPNRHTDNCGCSLHGETLGLVFTNQNVNKPFSFTVMTDVLTAASHTIKLVWKVESGTGTIYANSATSPVKLTVLETSMTT